MLNVSIDTSELERAKRALAHIPKAYEKAAAMSIRSAMKLIRTRIVSGITAKYYAKAKDVRSAIQVKASPSGGELIVRGTRKSLASYHLTPKKAPKKRRAPGWLKGAVRRDGLKSLTHGLLIRGYPYERDGPGTHGSLEGLKPIIAPAIPQLADNDDVLPEVLEEASERFRSQMRFHTMRLLGAVK